MPDSSNIYLPYVKTRIGATTTAYDGEDLLPLIDTAIADMKRVGINVPDPVDGIPDALCLQAVSLYCRGYFGVSRNSAAFRECYADLRDSMSTYSVYTEVRRDD